MSNEASGQGHRLGAGLDEREVDAGLGHQPAGVVELAARQVEPDRPGAPSRQPDRPLGRSAPELQDVLALDVAEYPKLRFRDLGSAPGEPAAVGQLTAVELLVFVAIGVP